MKNPETQWMIRSSAGQIIGPITKTELKRMIDHGKFQIDSEICPENSYLFTIDDLDELNRFFSKDEVEHLLKVTAHQHDLDHNEATRPISIEQYRNIKNQPVRAKSFMGIERIHVLGIIFFSGVVLSILAVVWILHRLNSSLP